MNQQTMETPGNTGDWYCGNSAEMSKGDSLFLTIVLYVLTRPACVLFMGISWFHLYSLCRFGRLYKNVPILFVCLLWWIGAVIYGVRLWHSYKRNSQAILSEEYVIQDREIKWFIRKKNTVKFFLKDKRVLALSLSGLDGATKDFLLLKLSAVSFFGKSCWRGLACTLIAIMTVLGAGAVARSAMPFQGKLGTYLVMWKDERTVKLVHDNIYEDGIQGVLEDVRAKVKLPDTLSLATSFNLHFAPDGKILTMDTMLYGFDAEGHFVDSYLISYNAQRSSKISVYLHGAGRAIYEEEKDLTPLIEAVSLMPWEQALQQWDGEDCYGILYYGMREWNGREGYIISLFCPENDQLTPVRYLCTRII